MPRKSVNPLLLPIEIGKSRPSVMALPPPDFAYGIKSNTDVEGAGAVIGAWKVHEPNAAAVPGRDFKTLNRMAIMSGQVVNATQIALFRREHDARLKGGHERIFSIQAAAMQQPSAQDPIFGIKSGDRIPIDSLMTNQYLKEYLAEQDSKQEQHHGRKRIPVMHTKASLGHRFAEPPPDPAAPPFKMKRFLHVPPRLRLPGSGPAEPSST